MSVHQIIKIDAAAVGHMVKNHHPAQRTRVKTVGVLVGLCCYSLQYARFLQKIQITHGMKPGGSRKQSVFPQLVVKAFAGCVDRIGVDRCNPNRVGVTTLRLLKGQNRDPVIIKTTDFFRIVITKTARLHSKQRKNLRRQISPKARAVKNKPFFPRFLRDVIDAQIKIRRT